MAGSGRTGAGVLTVAIDYSGFAIPKSRVKALDKADAKATLATKDKAENAKAKARAKGQCEVVETRIYACPASYAERCPNKDTETHHLIGGIGRRNKGKSILAAYKLRVCKRCHADITANILRPTTAEHDAQTVSFWRSR